MRSLLLLSLLLGGCQFIFEPNPEPRYRWVAYPRGGGFWQRDDKAGRYYWAGKDFKNIYPDLR